MSKRVALVLGSGGARGYAHIGVIELEARGYEIACIAGCSMGAVVGGIYAAGKLDEYRARIESPDYGSAAPGRSQLQPGAIRGERCSVGSATWSARSASRTCRSPSPPLPPTSPTSRKSGSGKAAGAGDARLRRHSQPVHPGDAG